VSVASILKRVPDIGRGLVEFVGRPRRYVANWKLPNTAMPSKEIIGWCLAASFLIFSAYELAFGSITANLFKAFGLKSPVTTDSAAPKTSRPTIEHIGWHLGFGVGITFPEALTTPTSQPQIAAFTFGTSEVVLGNAVPDVLVKKPITTLLLGLYGLITILCLHFPARILRGTGYFSEAARLALNYYAYVWLLGSLLAVLAATLLIHLIGLTGISLFVGWVVLVLVPLGVVFVRSFFAMFSEYYALSKKRLFIAGLGSMLLSSLLGPIFLVPCLYLLFWAEPLLRVIL
jgi:hypothetical protein